MDAIWDLSMSESIQAIQAKKRRFQSPSGLTGSMDYAPACFILDFKSKRNEKIELKTKFFAKIAHADYQTQCVCDIFSKIKQAYMRQSPMNRAFDYPHLGF